MSSIKNFIHHGFGHFELKSDTEDFIVPTNWYPQSLTSVCSSHPNSIPFTENSAKHDIATAANRSVQLEGSGSTQPILTDNTLVMLQTWLSHEGRGHLIDEKGEKFVPVLCTDKAIRYARTGQQWFKNHSNGYVIKCEAIPSAKFQSDFEGYKWTVKEASVNFDMEGYKLEERLCPDFYSNGRNASKKSIFLLSISSFDVTMSGITYRFFTVGEVDAVQRSLNDDSQSFSYVPVEIKKYIRKSRNNSEKFRLKLKEFAAKCDINHIPILQIGIMDPLNSVIEDTETYKLDNDIPKSVLLFQREQLEKAVDVFHSELEQSDRNLFYLNGFLNRRYGGFIQTEASDTART